MWTTIAAGLFAASPAHAQSADELAKQTQNPVSSLISVPLQSNFDFGLGDREATGSLLNIQPVMPFDLNESTTVILRVIVPLTSRPTNDGQRVSGFGDTLATAFFSPSNAGRIIWGAGPVVLLPTATNNALGTEKIAVGPSAVVLTQPGLWTLGFLFNHIWSLDGANDRSDVNQTFLQPFANYNLGGGLAVGVSLEAAGNWEATTDKWTAPLLFSVSKVTPLGGKPVNFQVAAGPTLGGPESGADWRFRLAATFLFPR